MSKTSGHKVRRSFVRMLPTPAAPARNAREFGCLAGRERLVREEEPTMADVAADVLEARAIALMREALELFDSGGGSDASAALQHALDIAEQIGRAHV